MVVADMLVPKWHQDIATIRTTLAYQCPSGVFILLLRNETPSTKATSLGLYIFLALLHFPFYDRVIQVESHSWTIFIMNNYQCISNLIPPESTPGSKVSYNSLCLHKSLIYEWHSIHSNLPHIGFINILIHLCLWPYWLIPSYNTTHNISSHQEWRVPSESCVARSVASLKQA